MSRKDRKNRKEKSIALTSVANIMPLQKCGATIFLIENHPFHAP